MRKIIRRHWRRGGIPLALRHGKRLGLDDRLVARWCGTWKQEQIRQDILNAPEPKPPLVKGWVWDLGNRHKIGKIIQLGPEVSEVQWKDGALQNVCNDYLYNVEAPKPTVERVRRKNVKRDKS